MSYSSEVLADSPLAYYRMSETSGTTLVDSSGNGHDGTYVGGVTLNAAGLVATSTDKAANFDGNNDYARVPEAAWLHPSAMSIEAWVICDVAPGARTQYIASKTTVGTINATEYQFILYRQSGTANVGFIVTNSSGTQVTIVEAGGSLTAGAKRHIVGSWDGTTAVLYVDGLPVGSAALSGTLATGSAADFVIGNNSANVTRWWDGTIDEVAYYGTGLSADRVRAHYYAGVTTSNYPLTVLADSPAAYWRMSDTGTTMLDVSGNNRHGTHSVAPVLVDALITDTYDASKDHQQNSPSRVTNATWMNTTSFTAEAWTNYDTPASAGGPVIARASYQNANTASNRMFFLDQAGNFFRIGITFTDATALEVSAYASTSLTTYHVVLTFDGTWARFYINGSEVYSTNSYAGKTPRPNAADITIGGDHADFSTTRYDGRIDEVAYYTTALSAARVLAHYQAGVELSTPVQTIETFPLNGGLFIRWPAIRSADSYDYSTDDGSNWTNIAAKTETGNILVSNYVTVTGLTNGVPYSVKVRGKRSSTSSQTPDSIAFVGTPSSTRYIIHADDFNRVPSATTPNSTQYGTDYTVRSNTWGISNGQLYTINSTASSQLTFPGAVNFDMTCTISTNQSAGLMFRWVDTNNFWLYHKDYSNVRFLGYIRNAGTFVSLVNLGTSSTSNVLRVIAKDGLIYFYVDGAYRGYVEDIKFGNGASVLGFYCDNNTMRYDNLVVWNTPDVDPTSTIGTVAHIYKGHDNYNDDLGGIP